MPLTARVNSTPPSRSGSPPSYHLRVHSSTGHSPHERFSKHAHAIRYIEDPDKIAPLFYTCTERVVRKDGTVTVDKKLFEVPLSLCALSVDLRYDPILCDRMEVWHKGGLQGLARCCELQLNSTLHNHHRSSNYAR